MKIFGFTLAEGATHVAISQNWRRIAFTLAEVLITLGIIGVVAALTMPTLIQKHQKQVWVNQLKKSYSTLTNSFKNMLADEQVDNLWDTELFKPLADNYDCLLNLNTEVCKATKTQLNKYLKAEGINETYSAEFFNERIEVQPNWLLADGSLLFIDEVIKEENMSNIECEQIKIENSITGCTEILAIYIDINGKKNPNKLGRDIFDFMVDNQGNLFYHYNDPERGSYFSGRIIREGWKMNY